MYDMGGVSVFNKGSHPGPFGEIITPNGRGCSLCLRGNPPGPVEYLLSPGAYQKRELIMPDESYSLVQLPGSERASLPDASPAGELDTSERAELTLILRRRAQLPAEIVEGPTVLSRDELAEGYGADPADVDLVRQTLTGLGLEVTEVHPATRRVKVAGTLGALSSAFGATLQQVSSPGPGGQVVTHRYREGPLYVPAPLDGIVLAVLGLDTRPQARAHFRSRG